MSRRCGTSAHSMEALSQWPRSCMETIQFFADFTGLQGATPEQFNEWTTEAVRHAGEGHGADLETTANRDQAEIECRSEELEEGVLAYAYLPAKVCDQQLAMRFNSIVEWTRELYLATLIHELGHTLGLDHSPIKDDVMAPVIDLSRGERNFEYGDWSLPQLLSRYGGEDGAPAPVPTQPTWREIVAIVLQQVNRCLGGNRSSAAIRAELRSPSQFVRLRIESAIRRRVGARWRDWPAAAPGIVNHWYTIAASASDEDLNFLIQEGRDY